MTAQRPKFRIEASRNRQWTTTLVAANGETVWQTEQFTTLGKAEESLFHVTDEVQSILSLGGVDEDSPYATAIPYEFSASYAKERTYEPRVAHRVMLIDRPLDIGSTITVPKGVWVSTGAPDA